VYPFETIMGQDIGVQGKKEQRKYFYVKNDIFNTFTKT
jgi:hypothetical protein